jgi:threonine/homoserine/homoserine lactone efflux protein
MDGFAAGFGLGLGSGLAPGPLLVLALAVTLRRGRRPGLQVAIAPLLSDLMIIAIALTVVSQLPATVITWLGVAGALVILFFAWETWRASQITSPETLIRDTSTPTSRKGRPAWVQGFLVNLLNPAPWIFWTTAGSALLLAEWDSSPADAIIFMVAFYIALVGSKVAMVLALSSQRHRFSPRVYRIVLIVAAIVLLIIGVGFLIRGVSAVLG